MAKPEHLLTSCTFDCPDVCSLFVERRGGTVTGIRGNPNHPFTAGFTCAKIRKLPRRLESPNRIRPPLLRRGTRWQRISWDEALDLAALKIQECRQNPLSILHIHGEGGKGVLKLLATHFFDRLGASEIGGSLCDNAGIAAFLLDFGSLESNAVEDLPLARRIVVWGKDLTRCSVHTAALVRKARKQGTRVLAVSPGGSEHGVYADEGILIRPGTDRFLAAAVIRLLVERGRIDPHGPEWVSNGPAFFELIRRHSVSALCRTCDVDPSALERLFSAYGEPGPVATLLGWGLQRRRFGTENIRFVNALAVLSGKISGPGSGSIFNISSLRNFNLDWARASRNGPRRRLLLSDLGREILSSADPPVRFIWVNGSNVVNQAPGSRITAEAFEQTPFKVVVDAFLTDTARRADLVLPCALMLEREDLVGSYLHDYVHFARRVVAPPGEARSDAWILSELGRRLEPPVRLPEPVTCIRRSLDSPYLDVTLETLREKGFVRARRPRVAYPGRRFDHRDGKARLPETLHPEPDALPGYPLHLLSLIRREAVHSQILPEDHPELPSVSVHPESPAVRGLDIQRPVFLASPLGRMAVSVLWDPSLRQDIVVYRRGDWMALGGGVNQLIEPAPTDHGEGTAFYNQFVRLEN